MAQEMLQDIGFDRINIEAPSFSGGLLDNSGTVELANYEDSLTILTFWVSWCGYCQEDMPDLEHFSQQLKPEDNIQILTISRDETVDAAEKFQRIYGISMPIIHDLGLAISSSYAVDSTPTVFILAPGGQIIASRRGVVPWTSSKIVETFQAVGRGLVAQ